MFPTFCVFSSALDERHSPPSGNANDGDLPLCGDGGGLPNNESVSLMVGGWICRERRGDVEEVDGKSQRGLTNWRASASTVPQLTLRFTIIIRVFRQRDYLEGMNYC